jgi:hypothetical protein
VIKLDLSLIRYDLWTYNKTVRVNSYVYLFSFTSMSLDVSMFMFMITFMQHEHEYELYKNMKIVMDMNMYTNIFINMYFTMI